MEIFCSTIIPTVNRSTLSQTVRSVLDQDFHRAGFEVIVVNDSGQPLPDTDWQHAEQVRVITTYRHERSVARNTGAAIARGKYFHFLDDDDLFLPGALEAFWKLDQTSPAAWLYGSYQTIDNDGNLVEEIHPEISGNIFAYLVASEGIPFQVSLLRSTEFFAAGMYDPNLIGVEDRDLGRRIARLGEVVWMPTIVAQIRIGQVGSTTDWSKLAERDRQGREKALNQPCALSRLQHSAQVDNFLRGRICRAYLASSLWNLQHRNYFIAASRLTSMLAVTGPNILSGAYWRGLRTRIKRLNENWN
ncbi:MAG: glycosyltransferase [Anaerolineales bacterium]|nr:glycosyltransferase [Anaerolineales bacterium]